MASLDLFEKNDLVQSVQRKSIELAKMLAELLTLPRVGQIRQKGFMVGVELKGFDSKQRTGAAVCAKIRRHGVILRPLGDVIVLMPPLAMELSDLRKIIDALKIEISALAESTAAGRG
jgi:adenosylmethionine-8-amino-7-oxononanoate aminotransferase